MTSTQTHIESDASFRFRVVLGIVAVALIGWMLTMFLYGPTIAFQAATSQRAALTVRCEALVNLLQDRHYYDGDVDTSRGYQTHYDTITGREPSGTLTDPTQPQREIDAACDRRRVTSTGLMALLATPTAILGTLALIRRTA